MRRRLANEFGDLTLRGPGGAVPGVRGEHRAGGRALVRLRPDGARGRRGAAVPGLLPPARVGDEHFLDGGIVNSIPLGRAVAARRRRGLRAAGRPDRPSAASAAAAVGRRAGVVRDRPPAPLRAGAGGSAGRRGRARAARARYVAARRHDARTPRLPRRRRAGSRRPTWRAWPTSTSGAGSRVTGEPARRLVRAPLGACSPRPP